MSSTYSCNCSMTEGSLMARGARSTFKNCVVIMTSNLAGQLILTFKGQNYEKMKEQCLEVLRQSFRPEFLNRVDEIVVFRPVE